MFSSNRKNRIWVGRDNSFIYLLRSLLRKWEMGLTSLRCWMIPVDGEEDNSRSLLCKTRWDAVQSWAVQWLLMFLEAYRQQFWLVIYARVQCFWPLTHWSTTDIWCFMQVTELKGQLTQVARSGSATSNNILLRSAMMSPSTAPSQYDEKHRSVLKKIEKDRKEAQEVRNKIPGPQRQKKIRTKAWKSGDRCIVKFLF